MWGIFLTLLIYHYEMSAGLSADAGTSTKLYEARGEVSCQKGWKVEGLIPPRRGGMWRLSRCLARCVIARGLW